MRAGMMFIFMSLKDNIEIQEKVYTGTMLIFHEPKRLYRDTRQSI